PSSRAVDPSGEWEGLLRPVGMVGPGIDLELGGQPPAEAILRQHALDRVAHEARRLAVEDLLRARLPDAARVAGVPEIGLVAQLLAREPHAPGIHHDDEVTRVEVG